MADRYEIHGRLGRGGIGAVYKGYDTELDRPVAIKRLLPIEETQLNQADSSSLSREATALAKFQHPNVVTIFGFGEDSDGPYVVMELIDGKNLKTTIEKGALGIPDFQEFVAQTLDAMIAAEQLNLLHRDIKPANLMLLFLPSGKFQVKILDFGLAKFSQTPSTQTLDHKGSFLGSIDYIAPEQIERLQLDQRTDLYAFGCVCYFALTQKPPFEGENLADTMQNHLEHRVTPIRDIRPDLPLALADWVMHMISRQPDHRPKSATVAVREFEQAKLGISPETLEDTGTTPTAPQNIKVTHAPGTELQRPAKKKRERMLITGSQPVAPAKRRTDSIPLKNTSRQPVAVGRQATATNRKQGKKNSMTGPVILLSVATLAMIGGLIFLFNGGEEEKIEKKPTVSKYAKKTVEISAAAKTTPAPPVGDLLPAPDQTPPPPPVAADLEKHKLPIKADQLVAHHVAAAMTYQLDQKTPAKIGDSIGAWGNFVTNTSPDKAQYLARSHRDRIGEDCPQLVYLGPEQFPELNGPHHFLKVTRGDTLMLPSSKLLADELTGQNLTVSIVFRAVGDNGHIVNLTGDGGLPKLVLLSKGTRTATWTCTKKKEAHMVFAPFSNESRFAIFTVSIDGDDEWHNVIDADGLKTESSKRPSAKQPLAFQNYTIGLRHDTSVYRFEGHLAELIIYGRTLADDERIALENHLQAKYFKK